MGTIHLIDLSSKQLRTKGFIYLSFKGIKETHNYKSRAGSHNLGHYHSNKQKYYTMEVNRGGIQEVIQHSFSPTYTSESSRYFEYPGSKPFVNSEYMSEGRPVDTHPKSNRDGKWRL